MFVCVDVHARVAIRGLLELVSAFYHVDPKGFELGLSDLVASALTHEPSPRPLLFFFIFSFIPLFSKTYHVPPLSFSFCVYVKERGREKGGRVAAHGSQRTTYSVILQESSTLFLRQNFSMA